MEDEQKLLDANTRLCGKNPPPAIRLGETALPTKSQTLEPRYNKTCTVCNKRDADGLAGLLCLICYRKQQFESFPADVQRRTLLDIVPARYIGVEMEDLNKSLQTEFRKEIDTGIVLWGGEGRGKTYAMAVLAKKFITDGFGVKRIHYEELCLKIRDTFNPRATQTEWGLILPLVDCDKLFIEDVGTTKSIGKLETDFSLRTFLVLLDMRMEQMRPTFITTNKSVENLGASFDLRVSDRLGMFKVFKMTGDSKRKKGQ